MSLEWKFKSFDDLLPSELYSIMQLRNAVFVVEQDCIYQDADNKDQKSFHLGGWNDHTLSAYCRIMPPGTSFEEASIGRVVTSPLYRNHGYGRELIKLAIPFTLEQFGCKKITIGAQLYLKKFYESLGFVQISSPFLEDKILHIEMRFVT